VAGAARPGLSRKVAEVDQTAAPGVVVHLNDAGTDRHSSVLQNVANLLDEMGAGLQVELVAHGPGVDVCLRTSPTATTLSGLMARGVTVAACENTLRHRGLERDQLMDGVITVPAGVAELVRRQQSGWAYVRP
jgi:intracellular sulfur oxidation DsrE/DsrF family protein